MEHFAGEDDPTVFGYSAAIIATSSMEPAPSMDDMIFNYTPSS